MPPAKKRKTRATAEAKEQQETLVANPPEPEPSAIQEEAAPSTVTSGEAPSQAEPSTSSTSDAAAKAKERMERFKALQARAKTGAQKNLKEATLESQRLATDPNLLTSLNRKSALASHNLLKADTEAAGEDFERKRAWDWTIEESERWDKRLKKKEAHRDDQAFQDYRQDSR
jgi:pre-mRNA-splicing factor SYF2